MWFGQVVLDNFLFFGWKFLQIKCYIYHSIHQTYIPFCLMALRKKKSSYEANNFLLMLGLNLSNTESLLFLIFMDAFDLFELFS